jgi:hypothetical protein
MTLKDILFYLPAVLICIVFSTESANAQSLSQSSKQIWVDFNPSYYFDKDFRIFGDAGIRNEFEYNAWWKIVVRPSVGGKLGGIFYYTAGIGNFYTLNKFIKNRWEIRPYQGVSFTLRPLNMPVTSYIRLEERFDYNTTDWKSVNSMRLRYQLSLSCKWGNVQPDRFWQVFLTGEAFFPLAGTEGQFREQFRLSLGLVRKFDREVNMSFELTAQQQQLFFDPAENISVVYFRFRVYHNWWQQEKF